MQKVYPETTQKITLLMKILQNFRKYIYIFRKNNI